jgi:hypothetical protein
MNFFSHFLVDHHPHKPAYNVALIMPDLLRNFTPKSCKFHFHDSLTALKSTPNADQDLVDFFQGCLQHIARDKTFHASHFFENSYQFLRNDWKNICQTFDIPKYWFSLHVLIEIMLDKHYIDNNLQKLTLFYHQLKTERQIVDKALKYLQHPNPNLFFERYDRFCEVQYLFHYQQIDRIAFALHRIFMQVNIPTQWYENHEAEIVKEITHLYGRWENALPTLGLHEIQSGNQGE